MIIEGDGFVIRKWTQEDAEELTKIANNPKIAKNMFDGFPSPYTIEDAKTWIKLNQSQDQQGHVILINNKIAGGIGYGLKDKGREHVAEIGYWLGEEYWGRGIGTQIVKAMTEYLFKNTKTVRIEAKVYTWNPAYAKVLEKNGYHLEGTLRKNSIKAGELVDEWLYSTIKE